jgi:hypothetical protein
MSGSVRKIAGSAARANDRPMHGTSAKVMMQFRGQRDEIDGDTRLDNGVRMHRVNEDRDDLTTPWPDAARFGRQFFRR